MPNGSCSRHGPLKDDTRPRFEVAAVRECVGAQPRGVAIHVSPGRLSIPCFPLLRLIQDAYQTFGGGTANFMYQPPVGDERIQGFPDEMLSVRYSIEAKAESPQSVGIMRGPMMQRLLEDRFHLKIHREIREAPVYIMTVAKGGPKLRATTEDSCNRTDLPILISLYRLCGAGRCLRNSGPTCRERRAFCIG